MTALEAVKEEAAKLGIELNDSDAGYILWNETGYPEFWNIPADGNTPEECLRKQVREAFTLRPFT
jgi:hypothetical protein